MDIQKENNLIQEAFEVEADEVGFCLDQKWGDYENPYENSDTALAFNLFKKGWQATKAQAVQSWISVEDNLPETEPNTDGVVCAVVCSLGNVYRARYMHDVDVGVDTKYWSEFAVGYNGVEHEHYEINARITHWMPLPELPTKECE